MFRRDQSVSHNFSRPFCPLVFSCRDKPRISRSPNSASFRFARTESIRDRGSSQEQSERLLLARSVESVQLSTPSHTARHYNGSIRFFRERTEESGSVRRIGPRVPPGRRRGRRGAGPGLHPSRLQVSSMDVALRSCLSATCPERFLAKMNFDKSKRERRKKKGQESVWNSANIF